MKVFHLTAGLLPTLSLAFILPPRDLVHPAPCVGIAYKDIIAGDGKGELEYNGYGVVGIDGSNPKWDAGDLNTLQAKDVCDKTINGQKVTCSGDVSKQCAGYGVASYNNLNCRTICPSIGDPLDCWQSGAGSEYDGIHGVIICDQTF
jgi:hypothetical protein